ncbi:MAG: 4Fe-4S binding protein [Desulfosarcina sp.]|nr:4Fe-4S binding protein [Desulfosarcina sp.]
MKVTRKIIEIDEEHCDGCGNCVISCAEGALKIIDGKAKVISDNLCDGLGACIGECPQDALKIIERETEEYDEEAVEKHCQSANIPKTFEKAESALTHWPVQIRLIPPTAPFLKGANLLVVADCVPLAFPSLHQDFIDGKTVMMGCPKFDDVQEYVDKFAGIFKTAGVKSVTTLIMEVPCCSGLPMIVKKGMEKAEVNVPGKQVTISTRGEILEER